MAQEYKHSRKSQSGLLGLSQQSNLVEFSISYWEDPAPEFTVESESKLSPFLTSAAKLMLSNIWEELGVPVLIKYFRTKETDFVKIRWPCFR